MIFRDKKTRTENGLLANEETANRAKGREYANRRGRGEVRKIRLKLLFCPPVFTRLEPELKKGSLPI
jgi:hypothetical protein